MFDKTEQYLHKAEKVWKEINDFNLVESQWLIIIALYQVCYDASCSLLYEFSPEFRSRIDKGGRGVTHDGLIKELKNLYNSGNNIVTLSNIDDIVLLSSLTKDRNLATYHNLFYTQELAEDMYRKTDKLITEFRRQIYDKDFDIDEVNFPEFDR